MGQAFHSFSFKDVSTKTVVVLYPLIFWALVLKIQEKGGVTSPMIVTNLLLKNAWTAFFYVGLAHLAVGVLISIWGTLGFLKPIQLLQSNIPKMARTAGTTGKDADATLRNQIKDLLVSNLTRRQLTALSFYSRIKQSIPLQLVLIAAIPGRIIVTIEAARFLSPIVFSWLSSVPYDLSSPNILAAPLIAFSLVNFNHFLAEEKSFHYRNLRPRYHVLRRVLSEFTIGARALTVSLEITKYCFGIIEVESSEADRLLDIIKDTLSTQIAPPLILFFNFEDLYPPSELKRLDGLDPKVQDFLKEAHPVAFVANHNNECVLFAEVDMLDVRRMDVWSRSPDLTRNIVAKTEKLLVETRES